MDGKDGVLIAPGDPALLAAAIRDVLADKASAQDRVEHAYQTATHKFSLATFVDGVNAVADAVVSDFKLSAFSNYPANRPVAP